MNHIEPLLKSLYIMASMVEARDPYTGGHLWRVSQYSRLLAEQAGLPANDVARIALGGFLHDLGKIGVPDAILNKPDKLSDTEYAVIQTHPEVGDRLLASHPLAELVREAVRAHHERPDGRGYPRRLSGADISIEARIVGITDAFDAMTSNRPYRRGMAIGVALDIIEQNLDRQFDVSLGKLFVQQGRAGALDHIVGHSDAGIPLQACPMCGPTIVVRRDQPAGAMVYCRHCGGQGQVVKEAGTIRVLPTGSRGSAEDLQPDLDYALMDELIAESARVLATAATSATLATPPEPIAVRMH